MSWSPKRTGAILLGWLGLSIVGLLGLEAFTLATDFSTVDHITAVVQSAFYAQPGVFVWLSFSIGFLCGHLFWGQRPKTEVVHVTDQMLDHVDAIKSRRQERLDALVAKVKRGKGVGLVLAAAALTGLSACGGVDIPDNAAEIAACLASGGTWDGTQCVHPAPPPPDPEPEPEPEPTPECLPGVPWCSDGQTCGECKHNPTSDPAHCEMAPACPEPPAPPPQTHCPIPEGVLDAVPGGVQEVPGALIFEVTQKLGPMTGQSFAARLAAFADAFTARTGWCTFAGVEAVFVKRTDGLWDEFHVAASFGGWTNSGRGKWMGHHRDVRLTPEGLTYPDPRGERMRFTVKDEGNRIDTTLIVYAALPYCQAIRMGKHGDLPRASCPVRPEGHPEREAWERLILGAQTHSCNGEPMGYWRGNPAVAAGSCDGTYRTCSEDGSVCTEVEL